MSSISDRTGRQTKEAGMVAIMVTLILLIVISLIVLGFAQISRRNQRQALDRQLSTQAFYAAETGVNDAAKEIEDALDNGQPIAAKPDCASTGNGFYTLNPELSEDVEYTCLTVDPTPADLVYSNIGMRGTVIPLKATSGTIASLRLTWQSKDSTSTPAGTCPGNLNTPPPFAAVSSWTCGYGVLRFDLVPTTGGLSMAGLQSSTMTAFVVPLRSGATGATANPISYATSTGGANSRLGVICSDTECSLTINGLTQNQYFMRVSSIYKDVSLQIVALDGSSNALELEGAQAVVDSTGRAQDVLRRIQVRLPLGGSSSNLTSDYAIQSNEAICKRFSTIDGAWFNDADNAVGSVAGSTNNALCRP